MAIKANKIVIGPPPVVEPVVVEPPVPREGRRRERANFMFVASNNDVQVQEIVEPAPVIPIAEVKANAEPRVKSKFQRIKELRKVRKERRVLQRIKRQKGKPHVLVNPKYVENTAITYTESTYLSDLGLTEG